MRGRRSDGGLRRQKRAPQLSIQVPRRTLFIFLVAPMVSYGEAGFPFLTVAGEFLLKDIVLLAAAVSLIALRADAVPEQRMAV